MSPYIDVMSYLLAVLTFSVGFLSTRRHAHVDVRAKDIADRSWKIRQALSEGRDLGPADLAEDIEAISVEQDQVVPIALWVNRIIYGCVAAVWLVTFSEHIEVRESFLNFVVLGSATAVWMLGEIDIRKMSEKEESLAAGTILGQLETIGLALSSTDPSSALDDAERLREAFPEWVYARELELALRLAADDRSAQTAGGPSARDGIHELIGDAPARGGLHAAAFLVAEERIAARDPSGALRDFAVARSRSVASRNLEPLDCVLNYLNSGPRPLLNGRPGEHLASTWTTGLEIGLGSLPNLRRETQAFRYFRLGTDLGEWRQGASESVVFEVVSFVLNDFDVENDATLLETARDHPEYEGALNTLGIACLAGGRDQDALRLFEDAIRARPNSSTSHWGRAVACARRDWRQAALDSLARATSLEPAEPAIIGLTQKYLEGSLEGSDLDHTREFDSEPSDFARVQMAILGLQIESPMSATGIRGRIVKCLIEHAGQRVATGREYQIG